MLQAITALFVIGAMLFGGAGATVYAAQDALPNDALYTLKTATEDLRLAFALDPQSELDLLLNYSDRRMSEVLALSKAGEAIPQNVVVRLNAEMDLLDLLKGSLLAQDQFRAMPPTVKTKKNDHTNLMAISYRRTATVRMVVILSTRS